MTYCHGGRRMNMKKNKNKNFVNTKVTCSCGNTFEVFSNKNDLHIEVCNKCHPFFTGSLNETMKTGRAEMFNRKFGLTTDKK